MELLIQIFGQGKDLSILQMSMRGIVIFMVSLLLVRIAGKRSFGMRMPLDNVLTILLGALLSRAIVGASPFFPVIISSLVIVLLYRLFAGLAFFSKLFGRAVKGDVTLIYRKGNFLHENMKHCMVTEKDIMEEVRIKANLDSLEEVQAVYVERNGEMGIIKKES